MSPSIATTATTALVWTILTGLATSEITYPAAVSISLLFPANKTYNTNATLGSPPAILAIHNAELAYRHEFNIIWRIVNADSEPYEWQTLQTRTQNKARGLAESDLTTNTFQYHANGLAIVPLQDPIRTEARAGSYRVEWDYATTACIPEGESSVYSSTRQPIASGAHWFELVDDGSGEEFGIDVEECPGYGSSWTLEDSTDCPAEGTEVGDRDREACASRLQSGEQVQCIWDYLRTGENETELCLGAFDRVDADWPMYYTPGSGASADDEGDDDDDSEQDGGDEEDDTSTGDSTDGPRDLAPSHRPALAGLLVAVFAAVVMAL
ncbi:hypothetical protein ASPCAL05191 [Aspergillus calidoustus]|uniref:DUF7136 domain-containing protein n=1 Tax=Aspergillus calidoustus TaxID=454130 RepID=A0A0U5FX20_ASPCI|nr:hypothetical protein ASPCAL05191 [Aspergillus calidoustus]